MADPKRRLRAILSADVAGYSRLMDVDEAGTLLALKSHLEALDPILRQWEGRVVKTTGDGLLVEFSSAYDAVRAALSIQYKMADRNANVVRDKRLQFRIGVHLGDGIPDGDDVFGNLVNIAVRLQTIADPGGICLSQHVHAIVQKDIHEQFQDIGLQTLKNISQPIHTFVIASGRAPYRSGGRSGSISRRAIAATSMIAAFAGGTTLFSTAVPRRESGAASSLSTRNGEPRDQGVGSTFAAGSQTAPAAAQIGDPILFERGKIAFSETARAIINTQISLLKTNPDVSVIIVGYALWGESAQDTLRGLAELRARRVQRELQNGGIDESRLAILVHDGGMQSAGLSQLSEEPRVVVNRR